MNGSNGRRRIAKNAALAGGMLCAVLAAPVAARGPVQAQVAEAVAPEVDIVVKAVLLDVRRLPCTASAEDIEAAIVYRLSQTGVKRPIIARALDRLERARVCQTHYAAGLGQVRLALLNRRLNRGTAALGGGYGRFDTAFSTPVVNVGGGSSNYAN